MRPAYVNKEYLKAFIGQAIAEDIGEGDHSTLSTIPEHLTGKARLKIKQNGIIAGIELALDIFEHIDPTLKVDLHAVDGRAVASGDVAFEVRGPVRSILSAERLVLNCMQRMSGIATYTHYLGSLLEGTQTKILDTRKTTPNLRPLEKWAVVIGGGTNHRFALYDMIMLKDNHVDYAGGIAAALKSANEYLKRTGKKLKIEIETRSLDEVRQVLSCGGAEIVMLDNMDTETMKEAVRLIGGKMQTEASGGITESNLLAMAHTGVDFISVGALTHSVKSLDMSLKAEIDK
ncbi:MAG: carboxylating nicotinate-nucleotide diphosphorylase [Cyclobacteriaceae bacterium]|nr:carboxylating nicotinate-nucleotide diphosphorylase [Cyclobacteriaceae bacterium]